MRLIVLLIAWCLPVSAIAQDRVVPTDVLALVRHLHRPADAIAAELATAVPHFRRRPSPGLSLPADPFLMQIDGVFGAPGALREAGLIHCARYGIDTRELIASRPASDPAVFPVISALRAAGDDRQAWPDNAIAVFRCSIAWDDARRVQPWREAEAAEILDPNFADTTRLDDAMIRAEAGDHIRARFGEDGFRLTGQDGPRSGYYWLESLSVSRELSHQRITFRAYLLGGLV